MSKLSNRLKELRNLNKLSQHDVTEKLDISTSAYGFYEQNKTIPSSEKLDILASYFNVTTDYLLGRTDNPSPLSTDPYIDDLIVLGRDMQSLTNDQKETILDMIKIFNKKNGI